MVLIIQICEAFRLRDKEAIFIDGAGFDLTTLRSLPALEYVLSIFDFTALRRERQLARDQQSCSSLPGEISLHLSSSSAPRKVQISTAKNNFASIF